MGAGIVAEARQRGAEVIVMGARAADADSAAARSSAASARARPAEIGEVTEYVLKKAPCRVLLYRAAESTQS